MNSTCAKRRPGQDRAPSEKGMKAPLRGVKSPLPLELVSKEAVSRPSGVVRPDLEAWGWFG